MSSSEMMTCASCGEKKHWRDGFQDRCYAQCWLCAWKEHFEREHPPTRTERRKAKKKALEQFKQQNIKEIQQGKMSL